MNPDLQLGEALVRERVISPVQLKQALDLQQSLGGDLKDILVKMGFVRDTVLSAYIAQQEHMHSVDLEDYTVDRALMQELPRRTLEKHLILPLETNDRGKVLLAVSDPNDYQALEEVQFLTNRPVESALAPPSAIRKALNRYFAEEAERARRPAGVEGVREEHLDLLCQLPLDALVRSLALELMKLDQVDPAEFLARAQKLATRG